MRRQWSPEDVVACWTPAGSDWNLVANKVRPHQARIRAGAEALRAGGPVPPVRGGVPPTAVDYAADVVAAASSATARTRSGPSSPTSALLGGLGAGRPRILGRPSHPNGPTHLSSCHRRATMTNACFVIFWGHQRGFLMRKCPGGLQAAYNGRNLLGASALSWARRRLLLGCRRGQRLPSVRMTRRLSASMATRAALRLRRDGSSRYAPFIGDRFHAPTVDAGAVHDPGSSQ
jgi:hypothetical protein